MRASLVRSVLAACVVPLLAACPGKPTGTPDGGIHNTGTPPTHYCPGSPGCKTGATASDTFEVGAAKKTITPTGFEKPIPAYLKKSKANGQCFVGDRCGELSDLAFRDCGTDMLCPGDPGYTGPDADGTENDGVWDFFRDCGSDNLCPGDPGYPGPDPDGTEGNGIFDGMWLAGFGNNRPATGVHDDIWARAVVMGKGDTKVAIAYLDIVGLFNGNVDKIRERVKSKRPDVYADLDYIFVGSTHVHEAPDSLGQWGVAPGGTPGVGLPDVYKTGINAPWMDYVIDRTADAIIAAYDGMKPAVLKMATGRTGADGLIHDSRDPVIIDDTINVVEADDAKTGDTICTLVNWGNHPESLASDNNEITSDYVGYIRDAVTNGLPAVGSQPAVAGRGGVTIFMQAEVGGLLTPLHVTVTARDGSTHADATWEKAHAIGDAVGGKALSLLEGAQTVKSPSVTFRTQTFYLPIDNTAFKLAFNFGVFNRDLFNADGSPFTGDINGTGVTTYVKTEMMLLKVGPATFLSVPGELFSELAVGFGDKWTPADMTRIDPNNPNPPDLSQAPATWYKEKLPGTYKLILGLGDDELGYLVPPYDFKLGSPAYLSEAKGDHYEETNSLGPDTVPDIEKAMKILIDWKQ